MEICPIFKKVISIRVGIEFEKIDVVLEDNYFDLVPGEWAAITINKGELPKGITVYGLMQELQIVSNYDMAES